MTSSVPPLGPAERRLLLACGRLELDDRQTAEVHALLRRHLDWEAIVVHARLHSVAPLLHAHLKRLRVDTPVPDDALQSLFALQHRAAYQNLHFARENAALLDAFAAAGVTAIVPKGLALVELVYGNLGLRPLIDLIFLVPERVHDAAVVVMLDRGYRRVELSPLQALVSWPCPQPIFKKRTPALHQAVIVQSTPVSWPRIHRLVTEGLFDRSRPALLSGRPTLLFSPADLVVYLALQADNHGFLNRAAVGSIDSTELLFATWSNNRLVRFTDLYETIRHEGDQLDWDLVVARARASMLEEPVHASLVLVNELLGPAAPAYAVAQLAPRLRPRVRRWMVDAVTATDGAMPVTTRLARARLRKAGGPQIRLAQLIGLAEFAFPRPETLRQLCTNDRPNGLARVYAGHTGSALAGSTASFAATLLRRTVRRMRGGQPEGVG